MTAPRDGEPYAGKSAFTPGPWFTTGHGEIVTGAPPCDSIAMVLMHAAGPANARLIAASPTLYEFVAKKAAEGDRDAAALIAAI